MKTLALTVALTVAASETRADSWAVGGFVAMPGQGSGLPIGGQHWPFGLTGSYTLERHRAIVVGLGVPIASVGASAWAGFELRMRPLVALPRLTLYTAPGLRTGFVGPGYYARHSGVFVGFEYIYSGPWTIAPRLPVGVAIELGRSELLVEVVAEAPLLPGPELLLGGSLGVRIAF